MSAVLYQTAYLIFVLILTFWSVSKYKKPVVSRSTQKEITAIKFIAFVLILFIGLRPINRVFVDMVDYAEQYNYNLGSLFGFNYDVSNLIFDNLVLWLASNSIPLGTFFFLISLIYFGGIAWSCIRLFPQHALLSFVMYLGAFSTFSFATNGIKAGAAASVFLVALSYKKNLKIAIPLLAVSFGFHHSMLAPIVAFVLAFFINKPKWYLIGWIVCFLLAAAHVTYFQTFFAGFTDEHGASYLVVETEDTVGKVSGFRPDFILYSAIPIFFGYYLITKRYIQSDYYNFLWCTYTLTNCVFLICIYGTFINRIAYLSWLMYPFVLLYPVINVQWSDKWFQFKLLKRVVWWHLYFTLFMLLVYYGFLRS